MLKIGLTGGIGSGKTTVAYLLKDLGARIIDADEICHKLMMPKSTAYDEIVSYFGHTCLNPDGTINRGYLRRCILNNPFDRQALEGILHPKVLLNIKRQFQKTRPKEIIVVDVPLLFEVGWQGYFDYTIVVYAKREVCLKRLIKSGFSKEEAEQFFNLQMPLEEKIKKADFIIENSGSLEETKRQVEDVWKRLKGLKYSESA